MALPSRTSIGTTSTPAEGATDWMTANWSMPDVMVRIAQDRGARDTRCKLLDQLQPFSAQAVFELHEARGVAARLRQALDKAGADRIGDIYENDRQGWHRRKQWRHRGGPACDDDIGRKRHKLRDAFAQFLGVPLGKA
jgi:hypothetical protein